MQIVVVEPLNLSIYIFIIMIIIIPVGWTMEIRLADNPSVQVCPDDTVTFVCNITRAVTHL